jgi:hypothetical protein
MIKSGWALVIGIGIAVGVTMGAGGALAAPGANASVHAVDRAQQKCYSYVHEDGSCWDDYQPTSYEDCNEHLVQGVLWFRDPCDAFQSVSNAQSPPPSAGDVDPDDCYDWYNFNSDPDLPPCPVN